MKSLKERALNSVFWTSIQRITDQGARFIVSIILARLLLPEEFGLIGMIIIFISIGEILMNSGLGSSIIRTEDPDQSDYSTVFIFNLLGSIIIYAIIYNIAPYISIFYNQPELTLILRLYSTTFIIQAFSSIQITRLHKNLDFKTETKSTIIATLCSSSIGIILAYMNFGVYSLVWMYITNSLILSILLWIISDWKPTLLFDLHKFKYHFKFGFRMTIAGLINTIFNNLYTLVIGKFYSPAQLGYYTRADTLKQFPVSNISAILNKVTYPLFAEVNNNPHKLKQVYQKIIMMVIFIITPLVITMGVLAEPLIRFLLTDKWMPAVAYFQILCINGIIYPLHSYNLNILMVKGRSDLILKLEIIKRSIFILIVLFSFQYGIYGLLWGLVVHNIICYIINSYFSGKFIFYPILEQLKNITPIILISVFSGVFTIIFDAFMLDLQLNDFLRLLLGFLFSASLFLSTSKIFKLRTLTYFTNIVQSVVRKS